MTWPILLHSVYWEGTERGIPDERWKTLFIEKLKEMGVEYIMGVSGGRINSKEFMRVVELDERRVTKYGESGRVMLRGSEFFSREAERESDMKRLFGEDELPIRGMPKLIGAGIEATMRKGKSVMEGRKKAIDQIFGMASLSEPAVRLIYSLCIIMSAHPYIVLAGGNLSSKKWDEPDPSQKHRTDKRMWAVAFAFSGLYYSGRVDRGEINIEEIKKGFLGEIDIRL